QAEDGIRDFHVTGVQTCALPIYDAEARRHGLVVAASAARPSRSGRRTPSGGRRGDREDVGDRAGPPGGADVLLGGGCSRAVRERSEERRVGKECRERGATDRYGE